MKFCKGRCMLVRCGYTPIARVVQERKWYGLYDGYQRYDGVLRRYVYSIDDRCRRMCNTVALAKCITSYLLIRMLGARCQPRPFMDVPTDDFNFHVFSNCIDWQVRPFGRPILQSVRHSQDPNI